MKNLIVALAAAGMLLSSSAQAYQCTTRPDTFSKQLLDAAQKESNSTDEVRSFLDKSVDIEHMSKSSLGSHWNTLTILSLIHI